MSFDFGLTPSRRKSAPRQGRRAAGSAGNGDNGDLMTLNELTDSPPSSIRGSPLKTPASAPHRGRGGWAASAKGGGFGPPAEDRRLQTQYNDSEDILDIPDLDEVVQDDFTQQVAQAPSVQVNRIATFKELDTDLLRHTAFSTLDDIDLRLLTSALVNEADVREPDIEWRWDPLFAEVSSELLNEWEAAPEESENERETSP